MNLLEHITNETCFDDFLRCCGNCNQFERNPDDNEFGCCLRSSSKMKAYWMRYEWTSRLGGDPPRASMIQIDPEAIKFSAYSYPCGDFNWSDNPNIEDWRP